MQNSNTCHTYTSVSDVNMFCDSGPNHEYYGTFKTQNSLSSSNVVNTDDVSLPPEAREAREAPEGPWKPIFL